MVKRAWHSSLEDQNSKSLKNLEHHQNVIVCSLARDQRFLKFSLNFADNFLSYFAKRQMTKQTPAVA